MYIIASYFVYASFAVFVTALVFAVCVAVIAITEGLKIVLPPLIDILARAHLVPGAEGELRSFGASSAQAPVAAEP